CAVVCWIRCFFVTCWTESWTHISGLYTCVGNSNSCVGYAHASIESVGGDSVWHGYINVSYSGTRLERYLCVLQAR
ncbi:unnamed protein product, partial [Trichobilharzia szidati]